MRTAKYTPKHAAPPSGVPVAVPVSAVLAAAVPVALGALASAPPVVHADARAVHQEPAARPLVTRVISVSSGTSYTVAAGDTLSGIAGRDCGKPGDWPGIWHANQAEIPNPDLIYPGQVLRFTCGELVQAAAPAPAAQAPMVPVPDSGVYSCTALESLWEQAGGPPGEAFMAAEIARAESGGNPNAVSRTDDWGLWQINKPAHPAQATFNPLANAEAAVSISSDGANWYPWTTYRKGLYQGQC